MNSSSQLNLQRVSVGFVPCNRIHVGFCACARICGLVTGSRCRCDEAGDEAHGGEARESLMIVLVIVQVSNKAINTLRWRCPQEGTPM